MKGGVELVPTHDDEEDRAWLAREREPDEEKQWLDEAAAPPPSRWRCLTQPLTPDTWRFLPTEHVRLLKFMLVSYALVVATHAFIRAHASTDKWERDERYSLDEFHLLDVHPCALDALWFFVVGRYWRRNGVDSACFLGPCVLGAYVFSAVGSWPVTHESISLYAIKCVWPRAFVALLGGVIVLVLALALLHVWRACKDGLFGGRVAEIACTVIIFWLPRARDSQFHVHHWFLTWFIGVAAASISCPRQFGVGGWGLYSGAGGPVPSGKPATHPRPAREPGRVVERRVVGDLVGRLRQRRRRLGPGPPPGLQGVLLRVGEPALRLHGLLRGALLRRPQRDGHAAARGLVRGVGLAPLRRELCALAR